MAEQKIIGRFEPTEKCAKPAVAFDVRSAQAYAYTDGSSGYEGLDSYGLKYGVKDEFWTFVPAVETSNSGDEPAFGSFKQCGDKAVSQGGVTVRDYFAAKAMQALVGNSETYFRANKRALAQDVRVYEVIAAEAYELADCMIKERV